MWQPDGRRSRHSEAFIRSRRGLQLSWRSRDIPVIRPARVRLLTVAGAALSLVMLLAGCSTDGLAQQYSAGSGKNYIAGDGTVTEIAIADRGTPVDFTGTLASGDTITSAATTGHVLVLNFWYAGCAPCRAEAPTLQTLWQTNQANGVLFFGVNVRDQADTARSFEDTYGVTYPSVLDANTGTVALAFAGTVAPNAVPTTLVVDRNGRVSARILGRIPDPSILSALIASALAENG